MSDQETPVKETPLKDEESPLSEERGENVTTQELAANMPEPVATIPGEQARPITPPPYNQPEQVRAYPTSPPYNPPPQPPHTWPQYYPGNGSQWARGEQYGPQYARSPRRRSPWPWIILAVVLLFMLLGGGILSLFSIFGNSVVGFGNTAVATRNFTVSANPTLVLNNDTGSIHVRVANSVNQVTIQATKHSNFGSNLNDVNVSYTQNTEGNTINVNVIRQNGFNLFTSTSVDFDITVPNTAELQLKTNTGSIDVTGVSGQMVLTSNTGSITAIGGTVSGNTGLITNTGSITFNGSINQTGNYRFETNTGSVNVTMPGGSAFHVNASTDTGSINTNFPGVTVQHQGMGANVSGDVGSSPQATVSLRTNTGSINLNQR
jgi:hypothetical protein